MGRFGCRPPISDRRRFLGGVRRVPRTKRCPKGKRAVECFLGRDDTKEVCPPSGATSEGRAGGGKPNTRCPPLRVAGAGGHLMASEMSQQPRSSRDRITLAPWCTPALWREINRGAERGQHGGEERSRAGINTPPFAHQEEVARSLGGHTKTPAQLGATWDPGRYAACLSHLRHRPADSPSPRMLYHRPPRQSPPSP